MTRHLVSVSVAGTTVVDAPAPFGATLPTPAPAPAVAKVSNGIVYGAKYERDLDVAVIAKRVRADIKAAVAAGELPAAKYSVRISRYSMGRSLDVTIDDVPFTIPNEARIKRDALEPHAPYDGSPMLTLLSPEALELTKKVEAIVDAYNFDGSDPMTDYFHVNFHSDVRYGSQESREWEALRAKYEAEKLEALRPVREANLAAHDALARRNACPAAPYHDPGAGCSLCEG